MAQGNRMMVKKARRWIFVWNNYTEGDVDSLRNMGVDKYDYLIMGFELSPTNGTPHLQGYVEFKSPISGSAVKKRLSPNAGLRDKLHLEDAYDKRIANVKYCSKDESGDPAAIAKYGSKFIEIVHVERHQGCGGIFAELQEFIRDGAEFDEVLAKYPEHAIKYSSGIERALQSVKQKSMLDELKAEMDGSCLKEWQAPVVAELCGVPHNRKVIWIYDTVGNMGKTWLSKYLVVKHGAARYENAGSAHIAFAYKGQKIVIFDFSRTVEGHLNYGIIESLKNGMLFSSKYVSAEKVFPIPHIICFANWPPNRQAMSADRWDIRCLDGFAVDVPVPQDEYAIVVTDAIDIEEPESIDI